jgi:hypothetical protein
MPNTEKTSKNKQIKPRNLIIPKMKIHEYSGTKG